MRIWSRILIFALAVVLISGCEQKPATPLETFKTYTKAIKKKDAATMKLLLSDATLKMHEQEAKAQNVPLDDIVMRETLFLENQKSVEYRDEKIDGDKATLLVKDSFGSWVTLPFIREDGVWKIDKLGYANQMMREIINKQNRAFDDSGVKDIPDFGNDDLNKQEPAFGEHGVIKQSTPLGNEVDDAATPEEMPKE